MSKFKIGLVLGGGGARGLAHIGVIKALEKRKIKPDIITGTSMGAFIGGLYSLYPDSGELTKKINMILNSDYFKQMTNAVLKSPNENESENKPSSFSRLLSVMKNRYLLGISFTSPYLTDNILLKALIEMAFGGAMIEKARIPFAAVAVDLTTGAEVDFKEGPFSDAILASMSIPAIFPPVIWQDKLLVDGGVTNMVPVDTAISLGAKFIVSSEVRGELGYSENFKTGIEIILRTSQIAASRLTDMQLLRSDVIISPDVKKVHWANFRDIEHIVGQGEKAALPALNKIRFRIWKKKLKNLFWHLLS